MTSKAGSSQPVPAAAAPVTRAQPAASAHTPASNKRAGGDGFVDTEAGTLVHRVGSCQRIGLRATNTGIAGCP